jgi:hypothetical protein
MIKKLATLKYWEIVALGLSATIAVMLGILATTQWVINTWPQATQAANMAYLILTAATAWVLVGITVEACMQRRRNKVISAAVDNIIRMMMEYPDPKDEGSNA